MSLPEMPHSDLKALQGLRGYRAERAERRLQKALVAQRAQEVRIEQTRAQLEQACQHEARQQAELLSQHQGQVISLHTLTSWSEAERNASAEVAREQQRLHLLLEQQQRDAIEVEHARKHALQCLRDIEKLRELSALWGQEGL